MKDLSKIVKIYEEELDGLKIVFIKRRDIASSFGMLTVKFGSMLTSLKIEEREIALPDGVAHFLEHRLFEIEGREATDLFSKFGADTNAFTGRKYMSFYFTTTSNFFECLYLLLDLVFTEKTFPKKVVEREKFIIANEINMYEDEPYFLGYQNLVNSLFWFNPLKKKVAGNLESIKVITPELLSFTYNNFFSKKNSILFVVGDIDERELFTKLSEKVKSFKNTTLPKFIDESFKYIEPIYPKIRKTEKRSRITKDLLFFAFKPKKTKFSIEEIITSNLILEIIFGPMSEFYDSLYSKALVDDSFNYTLDWEKNFCFPIISAYTNKLDELINEIEKEIERRLCYIITEEELNISKSSAIGGALMLPDNPASLIEEISTLYLSSITSIDSYIDLIKSINTLDVERLLPKLLPLDNSVTVTIKAY